ncbi:MAG: type III-A CRISPR-associated RAMP protein Csm5 [Candidatus Jordarchaeales archaeon]
MKELEIRQCVIKVLTPLHVGCGEAYEPFSFFVDHAKKQLAVLNMDAFITALNARLRNEFSTICQKGTTESLLDMYKFLRRVGEQKDIVEKQGVIARRIPVASGFLEHYREVVGGQPQSRPDPRRPMRRQQTPLSQKIITQFLIARTAFDVNGKGRPIIPGSSVKGAIRTAVLNLRRHIVRGRTYGPKENKELERDILQGSFSTDPLSLLKVSDFVPVGEPKMKIVYAVNVKKTSGRQARGPYQILEVVMEGEFSGSITLLKAEKDREVRSPLTFDEIAEALQAFYSNELKREESEIQAAGFKVSLPRSANIRIGRHSGAECVTIEGFRRIKIMGGNPPQQPHATTLWVASEERRKPLGCLPFGWCELNMR